MATERVSRLATGLIGTAALGLAMLGGSVPASVASSLTGLEVTPCSAHAEKVALPRRVLPGEPVSVRLSASVGCRQYQPPMTVIHVLDVSDWTGDGAPPEEERLEEFREAVREFNGALDPTRVQLGLVTYAAVARLEQRPTGDAEAFARRLDGIRPELQDTRDVAKALDAARTMLTGHEGQRVIVLLGGGPIADMERAGAAALRARSAGAIVTVTIISHAGGAWRAYEALATAGYYDLGCVPASRCCIPLPITQLAQAERAARVAVRSFTVVDQLSGDVLLTPGSARPHPDSLEGCVITWHSDLVVSSPPTDQEQEIAFEARYDVIPAATGVVTPSLSTRFLYELTSGETGELELELPTVEVIVPTAFPTRGPTRTPLPPTASSTTEATPAASATSPRPEVRAIYVPSAMRSALR